MCMFVRSVKFVVKEKIKSKAEASSVTKTKQQVRSLSKTQVIHNCAIRNNKKKLRKTKVETFFCLLNVVENLVTVQLQN